MSQLLSRLLLLSALATALVACETTDTSLRDQGRSETYVMGFHDGRHSGMKSAGNNFEHYIKDQEKFTEDADYAAGWAAGEAEGRRIQQQAQDVGEALGGAYSGYRVGKEVEKNTADPDAIAKDVIKKTDTSGLESLGK